MKAKFTLAVALVMILSLAFQATATQALPGTYFTGTDNENNAHTGAADNDMDVDIYNDDPLHPIEFNISVPVGGLPDTDAFLTIRAWDVDEEQGQKDEVFLNGTSLGFLSGTNDTWNTSAFLIPAGTLVEGNNLVQINVDTLNPPPDTTWLVAIDWGQVVVDGGVGTPGRINSITVTGYTVAGGNITLDVDVEIEALADGTFTLETNIYDPTANNVGANEQTGIAMTAGQILTRPVQFVFPEGSNGDIYTIRGFLFDEATGLLNSIKSTTWSYTIAPANTAPVAVDDPYATKMSVAFTGATVLGNDTDADLDTLTATLVVGPAHASAFTFNADGTFDYEPENGYQGTDTFTYVANDGTADSNVATVSVSITPFVMTIRSTNIYDGWVLESKAASNRGGSTSADLLTNTNELRMGDNAQNQRYRSIISFNTSRLPNSAVITSGTLSIKEIGFVGSSDPFTLFDRLIADFKIGYFGTTNELQAMDFQATATANHIGTFRLRNGWYRLVLPQSVYSSFDLVGDKGQFRLRFVNPSNLNNIANYARFYSGVIDRTNNPILTIQYYVPHP